MKKTIVLGASPNPERYAYRALIELQRHGYETVGVGLREGKVGELTIRTDRPQIEAVDTISLYVGPKHQGAWIDYIISLNPRRVILNPGTEDDVLIQRLDEAGIKWEAACTLVLLTIGAY